MHHITRITATIKATQTVHWPHFAGSTLRGAFGRALRHAACITGQDTCKGCPLRASCAYGSVFDPAPPVRPLHPSFQNGLPRYFIQPPALGACQLTSGQRQTFHLVLLPGSKSHQTLIAHNLRTSIEQNLIQPGLFKLVHASMTEEICMGLQTPDKAATATAPAPGPEAQANQQITLRWQTPVRLQAKGKFIFKPLDLDASTLVRVLLRRHMQWCQLTEQVLPDTHAHTQAASACTLDTSNMRWHDIERRSNTQKEKLPLGGMAGSATLQGPHNAIQTLLPLLQMGEQLHIGKEIVMGLGRYQLGCIESD